MERLHLVYLKQEILTNTSFFKNDPSHKHVTVTCTTSLNEVKDPKIILSI